MILQNHVAQCQLKRDVTLVIFLDKFNPLDQEDEKNDGDPDASEDYQGIFTLISYYKKIKACMQCRSKNKSNDCEKTLSLLAFIKCEGNHTSDNCRSSDMQEASPNESEITCYKTLQRIT